MRSTFILIALFFSQLAICQVSSDQILFKAKILDSKTLEILPYATVFNKNQKRGTASTDNGQFELPNNQMGDSVVISYVGYVDQIVIIKEDLPVEIFLEAHSTSLSEIVVRAESDFLYDILAKLRKSKRSTIHSAKTYLFLESKQKGEVTEMIESYFQGQYSNLALNKLNLKKGRIGLKPIDLRYYFSTDISE